MTPCPRCGVPLLQEYGRRGRGKILFAIYRCRPCKRIVQLQRIGDR